MSIFDRTKSKAAYQGRLTCPACRSEAIRYVEHIGQYRLRYRCRKCGVPFQYDISNRIDTHPYAPYKKKRWQDLIDKNRHVPIVGENK